MTTNENENGGSSDEERPSALQYLSGQSAPDPESIRMTEEDLLLLRAWHEQRQQRAPAEQQVTTGRIVHYWDANGPYDRDENNQQICTAKAAIVTAVHTHSVRGNPYPRGEEKVDLHVLYPSNRGMWMKTRVKKKTETAERDCWDWPERN
jgi:hypothetical protein